MRMLDLATIERDRAERRAYWRSQGVYADRSYADALRGGIAANANMPLVFHSQKRPRETTVGEIGAEADHVASAFYHKLGLRSGDRIAVMLPTWADTALAYVAAYKLGLTLIPIVAIYGAREIGFIMRQTEAKALVIPDEWRGFDYLGRVSQAGDLPALQHLIIVGDKIPPGGVKWDDLRNYEGTDFPHPTGIADEVALIIYTSGTTADPKGVKHTHNTMLCDQNAMRASPSAAPSMPAGPTPTGPSLAVFPAGHIAGSLGLMGPFISPNPLPGNGIVFVDQWIPEEGAKLIEKYKVSAVTGTPIFLTTLLRAAEAVGADLSSMQTFNLGASAVTPDNVRTTDKMGFSGGRTYGMSEHTVVSSSTGEPFEKRAFTDGKITARNQVRIVDDDGNDVPTGEPGEIVTLGPRLFMGYVDQELDKVSFLPGGWYKSGDIGILDAEGYLTITDRKKDIIIRGGENISAKEVEDILGGIPGVIESAVTAMPDKEMGERVCAFIVAHPGSDITLESVKAYFRDNGVTRQKTPERVVLVEDFPRTPSGKVKKADLRAQLRAEALAQAS
jgi:acyl-CoA synthetase (AMP-forming)/AMP-acid ligase II